jgi:coronin-1B/1C/6
MKAYAFKRFESDLPLIKGHAGPIIDFEFSPFNDYLLATASEDASVKLWIVPEEGVTTDITDCDAELRGHAKKLILTRFHPTADYTLATAGADMTMRIWDVTQ